MNKILSFVAAATVALVSFLSPAHAADPELGHILKNTVQINKNCSGTVIYSDRDKESGKVKTVVITAKHCTDSYADTAEMIVDFPVYQKNRVVKTDSYKASIKGRYFKADLALLELKDTQTYFPDVMKVAPVDPEITIGDPVITAGYPWGMNLTLTDGLFGSYEIVDYPISGTEYFRASPDVAPGNSGGALYMKGKDGKYALLGVTAIMLKGFPHSGMYTPVDKIHDYLKVAVPELYKTQTDAKK